MTRSERPSGSAVLWSTPQVARRLRVSEATVKRWTDEGLIACYRTPGGHRKFRPADVKAFAALHQFAPADTGGEVRAADRDSALDLVLRGEAAGLFELCRSRLEAGLPLERLCDEILGTALTEVGERWACASISVAEEHISTATVGEVLARLMPVVARRPARGLAVCACVEGERHDIASRMTALLLAARRYKVALAGADTPARSLARLIQEQRPEIVALSASIVVAGKAALSAELAEIAAAVKSVNGLLIAGGRGITDALELPPDTRRAANMRAFVAQLPG